MTDSTDIATYEAGSLFAEPDKDCPPDLIACIGTNGGPYDYSDFAFGYFELARIAGNSLDEKAMAIDVLFYPLTFAYRQGFELSIKHLILYLSAAYGAGSSPNFNHRLLDNWRMLRPLLEQYAVDHPYIETKPEQLDGIELLLEDFERFDPSSMVLRYPKSRDGNTYITGARRIDLNSLNRSLHIASNWFEGVINGTLEDLSEGSIGQDDE